MIKRDKKKEDELLSLDWIVLVFWECDIKSDISVSVDKINKVLVSKKNNGPLRVVELCRSRRF